MKTVLITNDWQIPFQDTKVIEGLFFPFLNWLKPDHFIWNGDIIDNYNLSEFSKNPLNKPTLIQEATQTRTYMARISKVKSIKRKDWLWGNHEDRLRRYMWQHAGRLQLGIEDTFESIFACKDYGFNSYPYGAVVALGSLDITHGNVVRQHSGWSAKAHFDKRGGSVLIGHTHRMGSYYRTNAKGVHVSFENGCLCSLTPEWVQDPDWQQGWSVVKVAPNGSFLVQQVPVINRQRIMYGNMEWTI
jgi:hypothetical protein